MRILDLFCGAGGAGEGYRLAGFDVTGVDIMPQKNNPHTFVQGDAIEYAVAHGHMFDAIHASPPCQAYSKASNQWRIAGKEYPDMIGDVRKVLQDLGKPYIIENVPDSPLIDPIILNGSTFGLLVHRPRLFETSFDVPQPDVPYRKPVKMGRPVSEGEVIQPVGHFSGVPYARRQMKIDWMTGRELAQAIPPAYTMWVSSFLLQHLTQH